MTEINDVTTPYELLIRYGDGGVPTGAHVQRIRSITIDGELIKSELLDPEPLGLADFPTSAIMSDTLASALAQVTTLTAQLAAAQEQVTA